jgi:hypothetical protein
MIAQVIGSGDVLSAQEQARLEQVSTLFEQASAKRRRLRRPPCQVPP